MSLEQEKIRLNKYIAQSGICGRNQAAEWVKAGHVKVNGQIVKEPFAEVGKEDIVTVKNKRVEPKIVYTYFVINKPFSQADTGKTTKAPDLQELLQKHTSKSLTATGNPGTTTCGLVVMTDDNELIDKLNIPGHKLKTVYEVVLDKNWDIANTPENSDSKELNQSRIIGVQIIDEQKGNVVGVEMLGGLYQEVIDFFEAKNYKVSKLDCTFLGGITKKDLKRGWSRSLSDKETVFIKHFT